MNKGLIGILILVVLTGCGNKVSEKEIANNTEASAQPYVIEERSEESSMIKACYGTVKELSESNVVIEGVDSKIYTGNPSGFEEVYQGEFVYLEFSSYEETEDGYNVKFSILRKEDRNPNSKDKMIF